MSQKENKKCEIWAIGGGKGGVGKSFLSSSICCNLAMRGKKVIAVDADFGGANLHTFLGISRPKKCLSQFFEKKVPLEELIVDCGLERIGLLTGAVASLMPDNIKHVQKVKFFNHLKQLDADYVLIDLGAGAHINTLDTFLFADKMVVVIVPEMISVENMYHFLKNSYYRKLVNSLTYHGYKDLITRAWKNRDKHNIQNLRQLVEHLKGSSPKASDLIDEITQNFLVYVVLNKVRSIQDIPVGISAKSVCQKYFGIHAKHVGYIEHDDLVTRCINKRSPYVLSYPGSSSSKEIERIIENIKEDKFINF